MEMKLEIIKLIVYSIIAAVNLAIIIYLWKDMHNGK